MLQSQQYNLMTISTLSFILFEDISSSSLYNRAKQWAFMMAEIYIQHITLNSIIIWYIYMLYIILNQQYNNNNSNKLSFLFSVYLWNISIYICALCVHNTCECSDTQTKDFSFVLLCETTKQHKRKKQTPFIPLYNAII